MAAPRKTKKFSRKEVNRLTSILRLLDTGYPDVECALVHRDAFELLCATILSAQCTDARVNMVTPALFEAYPTAQAMAVASPEHLQSLIRTTGFFRNKTKSLIGASQGIVDRFGGELPTNMEDLLTLPGVARKTANVVLGTAFGIASGVVVDTHVSRITQRLGFTDKTNPVQIERRLIEILPRDRWISYSHQIIHHGRQVCRARNPMCSECSLADLCPSRASTGPAR